jgi:hypothetical protein
MAVDTAQKRFSMMGLGQAVAPILFEQDGSVDADDRSHLLYLYSGITLSAPGGFQVAWARHANTLTGVAKI